MEYPHIQHHKKRLFIERFPEFGTIKATAKTIGIDRTTFYHWLGADEDFAKAFQDVKEAHIELLEAELYSRALDKERKDSILALIFALKALKPEKYREKVPEAKLTGDVTIHLALPERQYPEETPQIAVKHPKTLPGGMN